MKNIIMIIVINKQDKKNDSIRHGKKTLKKKINKNFSGSHCQGIDEDIKKKN